MWDAVAPTSLDIFFAGGVGGHDLLSPSAQVLVNWDVFNQSAIDWLNKWRFSGALNDIQGHTRDTAIKYIQDWVRAGDPLPLLEKKLSTLFDKRRAQTIARTEVTRMYAEGNIAAWKSTGYVTQKRWNTARDERVCPICGPLDGMIVQIDSNGFTTEPGGLGITAPPAHPNCRCWLTPVVSTASFEEEQRRALGLD
jgi:SPP1 gp7 family putative phage head morphogenesis protein